MKRDDKELNKLEDDIADFLTCENDQRISDIISLLKVIKQYTPSEYIISLKSSQITNHINKELL